MNWNLQIGMFYTKLRSVRDTNLSIVSYDRHTSRNDTRDLLLLFLDTRIIIKEEDGKPTLEVKDLTLEDEGDYTCKIGKRETAAKLLVDEGKSTTENDTKMSSVDHMPKDI